MLGVRNKRSGNGLTDPEVKVKADREGVRVEHVVEEVKLCVIDETPPGWCVISSSERRITLDWGYRHQDYFFNVRRRV
jgi:hypothetical protein